MNTPRRRRLAILLLVLVLVSGVALWLKGDFKRPLVAALRGADRIEVVAQRGWDRESERPVPFVLEGRSKVEQLLEILDFQRFLPVISFHCMCLGDTAIEFFDGNTKLATLTYHHGTHLRWHGGPWGTDVYLTPDAQVRLAEWFKDQGYERLQAMRDERLAEEKRESEETQRFYSFFPNSWLGSLNGDGKEMAKAVFRAFSATSLSWGVTGQKEQQAIKALSKVTDADILSALPEIQEDKEALLGFARFFFFNNFDEKIPEAEREKWAIRLAKVVLKNGMDDNKPRVMRYLRAMRSPAADTLLHAILDSRYPVVESTNEDWLVEPGLLAEAALCLAIRGDSKVKDRILTMLNADLTKIDRAALEVALATLGDPSFLKKEHFTFGSYSVGSAGLHAIEKYNGVYGMDVLVYGAFEHPWAAVSEEAVVVFERITGHVVWNRATNSRSSWYTKDAVAWWEQNGKEFVKQRRSALPDDTPVGDD